MPEAIGTHAVHNDSNLRMLAHHAQRDPNRAKHLMQGLRRQHLGARAIAAAAIAYGQNAPGHDEHALHLLNMAHAKVPDGAHVTFSQHGPHAFNANVKRGGQESNFPLDRNQLHDFATGPAGSFDHSMQNGVEKNLSILSRRGRPPVRGYDEGGPVGDQSAPTSPDAPNANPCGGHRTHGTGEMCDEDPELANYPMAGATSGA